MSQRTKKDKDEEDEEDCLDANWVGNNLVYKFFFFFRKKTVMQKICSITIRPSVWAEMGKLTKCRE